MSDNLKDTIFLLLKESLNSEIDLQFFCEEFCFTYLQLEDESFKRKCSQLFHAASDYLMSEHSFLITISDIEQASELFSLIKTLHQHLLIESTMN